MGTPIQTISVEGFKSIRKLSDFELRPLNVLIGANGAGKSNFVDLFRLLRAMADKNLTSFVNKAGGADSFFYLGPKYTPQIRIRLGSDRLTYACRLEPTAANTLLINEEEVTEVDGKAPFNHIVMRGKTESNLITARVSTANSSAAYDSLADGMVYHFHDTSALSPMRREQSARDFDTLRSDASNIAAYLLNLQKHFLNHYTLICDTIRLIAPFFEDFRLRPEERGGEEKVRLEWLQKGSDFPFQPSHLSDGTLRFICLATALLQPKPPSTIVIDEPELGLHPHALEILAGLLSKAADKTQIIVSTQSAPLLSQFDPADVVVVNRHDGASVFNRLDAQQMGEWLDEYTLGELWQKNYVDGGATNG